MTFLATKNLTPSYKFPQNWKSIHVGQELDGTPIPGYPGWLLNLSYANLTQGPYTPGVYAVARLLPPGSWKSTVPMVAGTPIAKSGRRYSVKGELTRPSYAPADWKTLHGIQPDVLAELPGGWLLVSFGEGGAADPNTNWYGGALLPPGSWVAHGPAPKRRTPAVIVRPRAIAGAGEDDPSQGHPGGPAPRVLHDPYFKPAPRPYTERKLNALGAPAFSAVKKPMLVPDWAVGWSDLSKGCSAGFGKVIRTNLGEWWIESAWHVVSGEVHVKLIGGRFALFAPADAIALQNRSNLQQVIGSQQVFGVNLGTYLGEACRPLRYTTRALWFGHAANLEQAVQGIGSTSDWDVYSYPGYPMPYEYWTLYQNTYYAPPGLVAAPLIMKPCKNGKPDCQFQAPDPAKAMGLGGGSTAMPSAWFIATKIWPGQSPDVWRYRDPRPSAAPLAAMMRNAGTTFVQHGLAGAEEDADAAEEASAEGALGAPGFSMAKRPMLRNTGCSVGFGRVVRTNMGEFWALNGYRLAQNGVVLLPVESQVWDPATGLSMNPRRGIHPANDVAIQLFNYDAIPGFNSGTPVSERVVGVGTFMGEECRPLVFAARPLFMGAQDKSAILVREGEPLPHTFWVRYQNTCYVAAPHWMAPGNVVAATGAQLEYAQPCGPVEWCAPGYHCENGFCVLDQTGGSSLAKYGWHIDHSQHVNGNDAVPDSWLTTFQVTKQSPGGMGRVIRQWGPRLFARAGMI